MRLFKEYSVIKLFGITLYERFAQRADSSGGGVYNVAFYAPFLLSLILKREQQFAFIVVRAA